MHSCDGNGLIEAGFYCMYTGSCSKCEDRCGDGLNTNVAKCDDGNMVNGDGCDSECNPEAGFTCPTQGACVENCDGNWR